MAKTLTEIYGFKKSAKRMDAKNLRKLILKEYRSILREQEEEEVEASGEFTGEYKGDAVDKTTNVKDVDPVEIVNQLLSGKDDSPIVQSASGKWFAYDGAAGKAWVEKVGPQVIVDRIKVLADKVPDTGLPKSVMPFLPGPGDAKGDFSQVEDALQPGGEFNVDTHPESGGKGDDDKKGDEDKKEAIFRAAEYLISEKTAPPAPNTFTSMDDAAKAFMTGGLEKQDGQEDDDVIKITKGGELPATSAIPTQANILIYKAVGMAVDGMAGGDLDAWAGTNGEILDGHHRWAATMLNDPSASLGLAGQVDLQGLGSGNEQEVLKYLTAIGNALGNKTKTESRRRASGKDKVIMERWNKLAGLLKD